MRASRKGKARAEPERRVLPARIRRAAGGGAEGIRDLEGMIVDWLERWETPCASPPDELVLQITTLPLSLVEQTICRVGRVAPPDTDSPTRTRHLRPRSASPNVASSPRKNVKRIETPSWIFVKPGEDDKEEAKEELQRSGRKLSHSPIKRLRKDELTEDTSDAYYINLHKRHEVFERRQHIREKEKLMFERYKMRSRIDLLRNMSVPSWTVVVAAVLSRDEPWESGRAKLGDIGVEWLRHRLVREGLEVMQRYDQLLPVEKKQKAIGSRNSTPSGISLSGEEDVSPAPPVLNARVAALRNLPSVAARRSLPLAPTVVQRSDLNERSSRTSPRKRRRAGSQRDGETPSRPQRRISRYSQTEGVAHALHDISHPHDPDNPPRFNRRGQRESPFQPPLTQSGQPILVEAAARRESALAESDDGHIEVATHRSSRLVAPAKVRMSSRLEAVIPFGMPIPSVVDLKYEFTLSDKEEFWAIIADREERANEIRRWVIPVMLPVSKEEALEMEGVEAAVVFSS
ncbi:MAG: hypothetical protein TREMPRED_000308 [Tremellales sp. Tagirdzhanova-0007]|nr:MAG: hypothetical protein TREMPRED_000308 [Tremellales sp. Tagirdzhanova-0007]